MTVDLTKEILAPAPATVLEIVGPDGITSTLRAELVAAQQEIEALRMQLRGAHEAHRKDISIIGGVLLESAEEHDWCSVYDRAVEDTNTRLTFPLPLRSRTYNVRVRGYARVPWTYDMTVEVDGGNDLTDAIDAALGDLSYSDVDEDTYDAEILDDWQVVDTERA